jgi:tRNA 2-thiouridine synthesizing protein A
MVALMHIDTTKINSPGESMSADGELDLTGMKCPLPVLKARRKINQMAPRSVLKVTADDPAAPLDFEHFCHTGGHDLLSSNERAGTFTFYIAKSPN